MCRPVPSLTRVPRVEQNICCAVHFMERESVSFVVFNHLLERDLTDLMISCQL